MPSVSSSTSRCSCRWGSPCCIPGNSTEQGCLALVMYNTGEPSHKESAQHHPLAQVSLYHDIDSFMDIPWAAGSVANPSVASGCMIKLLNFNPISYAMTCLYCMTPNVHQDNISYHDCAEEGYHLLGTFWMMQLGDVPTGGYCWRPAYINHGAFASEFGCIALGRTDSKLFNHFHYIPWSTPVQNAEMKLAMIVKHTRPTVNPTGTGTIIMMMIVSITTIITVMTNG